MIPDLHWQKWNSNNTGSQFYRQNRKDHKENGGRRFRRIKSMTKHRCSTGFIRARLSWRKQARFLASAAWSAMDSSTLPLFWLARAKYMSIFEEPLFLIQSALLYYAIEGTGNFSHKIEAHNNKDRLYYLIKWSTSSTSEMDRNIVDSWRKGLESVSSNRVLYGQVFQNLLLNTFKPFQALQIHSHILLNTFKPF